MAAPSASAATPTIAIRPADGVSRTAMRTPSAAAVAKGGVPGGGSAAAAIERDQEIAQHHRSDERRVGKECGRTFRSRWSPYHDNQTKQCEYTTSHHLLRQ